MVGEKLERDDGENRRQAIGDVWQRDNFVRDSFELLRSLATGERDDGAFARFDLLDVVQVFRKDGVIERDWKIKWAPEEKHPVHTGIFFCNRFDLIAQLENILDLFWQCFERGNDPASFRSGKVAHPTKEQADKSENDELG